MTYSESEARERLEEAIYFAMAANMGTTPDQLLDDYRDAVLHAAAEKIRSYADPADEWAANLIDPEKQEQP